MEGSRAATSYGEHVATELTTALVERGHAIITGAAYGIEAAATRATLTALGTPIAVLAGGIDRPYPAGHTSLLERVAATGAVISEVPPRHTPTKWRFLARGRILAALAQQIVIVEAGWRSGALNTATHAIALDRFLGAVPGPITSAASAGCHRVIRELDAHLVTSADDIPTVDNT
ncbi:DNA protecting protein DprA [Microbacterium immunditiarum]|uniref:DNA protecting protein DprA n=1 Tax=Microbacterium immunditiarum TaxID=337480 RepID=A0A7Y9GKH2_9MICO|nr:DNA protecting protein DprA [Microbacterium immunditiarum]